MSRHYTPKPTSNLPWNWTDQRVQEIMKKYEQPLPSPRQDRTPLRTRNNNQPPSDHCNSSAKSPWKQNYYKPTPSRQDCTPTQNKTFDLFSKENSYERSDRSRGGLDGGRSSKGIRYRPEAEMTSIYDYTNTTPNKSKESELMDAKNYLREQERKYLKFDVPQKEHVPSWRNMEDSNWRDDYKGKDQGRRRERNEHQWNPREDTTYKEREATNWRQRDSLRSQKMKTECPQPTLAKDYGRKDLFKDVEYEPRINNIERINNKIKKILESAQEERLKVHQSTAIELKPTPTTANYSQGTPNPISKKPQQTKESSAIREGSIYESSGRRLEQRSKSCLVLKKNLNIQSTQGPCQLTKKVNDQLAKFNHKISQLQEQKRKLNISFKNAEPKTNIPITSPMQLAQNPQINKFNDNDEVSPLSPLTNTFQESTNNNEEQEQVSPNFHSPYIGLKDLDIRDDSLCLESHEQLQQITRNMEMRRRQRQAEAESSPQRKSLVETNKLMAMLSEQVQLDEQLQLAKKWFARCALQSDWTLLQELLAQRWREMTNEELHAEFSITLDEEDPFYSYRPDEFQLEDMVANYIICCRHWGEKVEGQWNGTQLREEECFKKLDRDGRGEVEVEDLVREINLSQEVFYRNRNLYLIYQRLTHHGVGRLTEDKFYSILAKK